MMGWRSQFAKYRKYRPAGKTWYSALNSDFLEVMTFCGQRVEQGWMDPELTPQVAQLLSVSLALSVSDFIASASKVSASKGALSEGHSTAGEDSPHKLERNRALPWVTTIPSPAARNLAVEFPM